MKKEKIVLSFLAVIAGLVFAGAAFYFYQSTKVIPEENNFKKISVSSSPKKEEQKTLFLSIDKPKDEEVVDTKTITIAGKTTSDSIIVVSTNSNDQVFTPAKNGNFSTTQTITDGLNYIEITAIAPNGEEEKATRIVTYSNETF